MLTVHFFLEISIAFVLKLFTMNVIKFLKKIENQIELRACESESNRYPALAFSEIWFGIRTGIWVLQLLFEAWEGRTKGLGVLQEHFVHDQHRLLANVWLSVGHLRRMKGETEWIFAQCQYLTEVNTVNGFTKLMMSLARSRARSGVTKQERPVRATPVSHWLGLLRSCWEMIKHPTAISRVFIVNYN